jgi:hypothetical protein
VVMQLLMSESGGAMASLCATGGWTGAAVELTCTVQLQGNSGYGKLQKFWAQPGAGSTAPGTTDQQHSTTCAGSGNTCAQQGRVKPQAATLGTIHTTTLHMHVTAMLLVWP